VTSDERRESGAAPDPEKAVEVIGDLLYKTPREAAARRSAARNLRREIAASLIAVKPHLDKPYPDDPRWTPWTRFIERTLERVDELAKLAGADRGS
jgi:hypothetical protein